MKSPSLPILAFPLLAASLPAQGPDNLIGLTRNLPALRQQSHAPCALLSQCPVAGLPPATPLPPFVGGTAWDPTRSGAWVTNGILLAKYDDMCAMQCPPNPMPSIGPGAFATGLELVEGSNQVWVIDSAGWLHFYTNSCPPMPAGSCNTGLAPTAIGNVTSGLAVDEGQGLVFIAFPMFPGGPNRIIVSTTATPCMPVTQFMVPPCAAGFGAVTGLACDWGNRILYATDGLSTVAMTYVWVAPALTITGVTCCAVTAAADPLIGLAVRPGRAMSTGSSCSGPLCPVCPQVHTLANDPCLGNAQFRLDLSGAAAGSFAFCLIGAGPCFVPGPVVPPLCGPLHTLPYLGMLGPVPTGGPAPCGGFAGINLPLPVAPGLAGLVFSSQYLTLCPAPAGFGFGLSNCLSWQLQGN